AADAVAHPSEQECPQGPNQESRREQRNGAQQRRDRMALFEELDRQDRGQAPENIEVIPFDDVSHRRRDDHAPEIPGDFNRAYSHSHLSSPYCLALLLHRFVARACTGAPRSECVLTRRNCSRTEVDRCNGPSLDPRPPRVGSETMKKRYHCGGRDLIRLSA